MMPDGGTETLFLWRGHVILAQGLQMGYPPYPPPGAPPYYQPAPYQPVYMYPPPMMYYDPARIEANKAADTGLLLGVLGFFFLGIVLGPLAIYYGMKARRLDPSKGLAGIILGGIVLLTNLASLLFLMYMFATMPLF